MQLLESGEMYLETIYILSKKGVVHSVDVSEYMNFTKPSVSRAIGLLKEGGYVQMEKNGELTLTDAGRRVAENIYEKHCVITAFLTSLGVDPDIAVEDACKMEHYISDASFKAIKDYAEQYVNKQNQTETH
ncbi:MAG: metal-dependent transcriptional regulator [Clostridia bacterium]|nr:metal-dependent transcriptional regulator [Clostridia bacterium]